MASDTDTEKARTSDNRGAGWIGRFGAVRRKFSGSRLGGLILALNLLSLLILFVGALLLNEWRRNLVDARLDSLTSQAELLASVLGELGITRGEPTPYLDGLAASQWLRDNFIPRGQRVRLYDQNGLLLIDS
jgi:two-component system, OmpR family, sensor histidine kinase ChvG